MGGKTSTSSSQVQIPPEVLARYNSVNATAQNVAQTPFQQYSTNPNAFVAPMTATQNAGVAGTNAAAGEAQPYFNAATGFALAGSQPVNAAPLDTSQYMNPYLNAVLGSTEANVNQQNQQAMSGQTGNAMSQGYFGGDRSGIASAVLQGQQELAGGQLYSGIASDAYTNALAAAQQQQGVNLGAAQANRAATQNTASTLAGLGTGAQGAALEGAQAQLGAGQVEQQTQQAGDTALYNQFLQQQSYPFQTAQFLANIAEGTGALSGSTTTSTQPGGLFSDERLKEDMEPIGKGFDGANIYRFRYKGDPTTRIGLSAQETERKHPEAVSEHGGFKAVDYGQATEDAARRGGFALAANDNGGDDAEPRRARQAGGGMSEWGSYPGGVNPMVIAQLLQAQATMYGPGFGGAGLYGNSAQGAPHGGATGYVPPANLQVPMLQVAHPPAQPQKSALDQAASMAGDIDTLSKDAGPVGKAAGSVYGWGQDQYLGHVKPKDDPSEDAAAEAYSDVGPDVSDQVAAMTPTGNANGGFIRARRQDGGLSDPENDNPYAPKGPGLNIPMQGAATPKLATAPTPGGGGGGGMGGLGSMLGAGADIATIAKAAPAIGSMASGIGSGIAGLLPFLALQRGGRAGYADGGDALDIPDDTPHAQLAVAQPPKQGNGGDNAMGDIMDVAKIAAMFAARGGRIERDDGGPVSASDYPDPEDDTGDIGGSGQALAHTGQVAGAAARAGIKAITPIPDTGPAVRVGGESTDPSNPNAPAAPPPPKPPDLGAITARLTGRPSLAQKPPPSPSWMSGLPFQDPSAPAVGPAAAAAAAPAAARPPAGQAAAPSAAAPTTSPPRGALATQMQHWIALGGPASGRPMPTPSSVAAQQHAVAARQAAAAAQHHATQAQQAAAAPPTAPSTPASLAAAAATGMPSSVSTPGFGNASSGAAADSSMAAQVPPSTADVRGFGRAGVPSAAAAVPDILASAQGREAAPPLSDTDAAAGLGQGPTDPTTGLAAPGFGGAAVTPHPVQHVGGPPLPTTDAAGNPVSPGAVQHEAGAGYAPMAQAQPSTPAGAHAAASAQQGGFGGMLSAAAHALGKPLEAVAGLAGYNPQTGQWDRDKLIPFISAIAGTLAAPTKYPLVALSQGALAGGQSYMQQQQREASIASTDAQTAQTLQGTLPPALQQTSVWKPGAATAAGQRTTMVGNQPWHLEFMGDQFPRPAPQGGGAGGGGGGGAAAPAGGAPAASAAGTPAAATAPAAPAGGLAPAAAAPTGAAWAPGTGTQAISPDYDSGTYNIGPTAGTVASMKALYPGIDPTIDPRERAQYNAAQIRMADPNFDHDNAVAGHEADQYGGDPINADNLQANQVDLATAVASLPETGGLASGPGAEARTNALNWARQALRLVGVTDPLPDVENAASAHQVIEKLNGFLSQMTPAQYGLHASAEAHIIREILPNAEQNKGAAMNVLSHMMVQTQKQRDFANYRQSYKAVMGTDIGVVNAFRRDTQGIYDSDEKTLPRVLMRGDPKKPSIAETLIAHPETRRGIEQGTANHKGVGPVGRYLIAGAR